MFFVLPASMVWAAAPSAPTTYNPSGTIYTATPTFSWSSVSGASYYIISVHRSADDNYEFEVAVTGTSFRPGSLADTVPGSNSSPSVSEPTYLIANTTYNWWVRAVNSSGQAGAWSSVKTFEYSAPSLLGTGLHSHVGYPTEIATHVDQFNAADCDGNPTGDPTSWATMNDSALVNHANSFGNDFFVYSGADWRMYYNYFGGRWIQSNLSSSVLSGLTTRDIVLHPITLPREQTTVSMGNDVYGNTQRKTIALIGADYNGREAALINQDPVANGFGFATKDLYHRFRVPGMFNITIKGTSVRPTDADLYQFDLTNSQNLLYTELEFHSLGPASFEQFVEDRFTGFLKILKNQAGSKGKYMLLGNEPEGIVRIHPQIYARMIALAYETLKNDNIKIVLANFAQGPSHLNYMDIMMDEFRAIYGTDAWGRITGQECPFQASSIDYYLQHDGDPDNDGDDLTYDEIARQVGLYKQKVQELRNLFVNSSTTVDFFIKEGGFSLNYFCAHPGLLDDINSMGTGASMPAYFQDEVITLVSFFKQLGFQDVAWFNHFRTPAEHGDLLIGTAPISGPTMTETKFGDFLSGLN
ncbi:MAG: hypothetical protein QNK37_07525 [Acidobacteriota bacterium]|nr:hypothetical protein [Acidobacteriota bacterium]